MRCGSAGDVSLLSSFYLVIYTRVLCSSLGGYMLSYAHEKEVGSGEGIEDCRAAREVDSKLGRVTIIHFYSLNHTSLATYASYSIFFFYAL